MSLIHVLCGYGSEQMFGRHPFTGTGLDESRMSQTQKLFQEEMQNATIHFGEGRMNPATIACIFARVEERLTGKFPELRSPKWGYEYALKAMGWKKTEKQD